MGIDPSVGHSLAPGAAAEEIENQCTRYRRLVPMQRWSDAELVSGAPDGARSGLPARAPPSDPRRRVTSQRRLRQIMQFPSAPSQARGAPLRAHVALARAANSVLGCSRGAGSASRSATGIPWKFRSNPRGIFERWITVPAAAS